MNAGAIDAVSLSIMWDRLIGITDEIISALVRSSFSTIVRESGDLSVVVLDAEGNSVAQGQLQRPLVHRHRRPHPAPHAGEIPAGVPGAGRRHRHQRRVDGYRDISLTST